MKALRIGTPAPHEPEVIRRFRENIENDQKLTDDAIAAGFEIRWWQWGGRLSVEISHPDIMPNTTIKLTHGKQ